MSPRPAGGGRQRPPRSGGRSSSARRSRSPGPPRRSEEEQPGDQVEGRQAVRELLAARRRPTRQVLVSESASEDGIIAEIVDLARANGVPVVSVPRSRLVAMASTDAPQGVVALADPLPETSLAALVSRRPGRPAPMLVVLDGVTDPHNLGAVMRSALCAGATGVIVARHRAAQLTPTAIKAAAGAVEHLPVAVVAGIAGALSELSDAGVWCVGLDAEATSRLWDLPVASEPVALVLGAEGSGLSRLVRQRCELVVAVPLQGPLGSLNVSAAAALACFEVARRRGVPQP